MWAAGPVLLLLLLVVGVLTTLVGSIVGINLLRNAAQRSADDARRASAGAGVDPHNPMHTATATRPANELAAVAVGDLDPAKIKGAADVLPKPVEAINVAALPVVAARPPALQLTSASLLRVDDNTGGGWIGRYGARGYSLAMATETPHLPPGVRAIMEGAQLYTWGAVTTDPRALSTSGEPLHLSAGQWFAWEHFSIDLDLREAGKSYQVALYLLDWDSDARGQQLDVVDASTGAVLFTRSDAHFAKGRYVLLRLSGRVILRFSKSAGANGTLSGMFFDDVPGGDK
jgi:hypothetical protein